MVARVLQLRLGELGNRVSARSRGLPLRVLGWVLAGAALALGVAVIVSLIAATPEVARASLIVVGSLLAVGFVLLPLAFGADTQLDPRRFELYGIRTPVLAGALAVAGVATVPVLMLAVLLVAQLAVWMRAPLAMLVAVLGSLLFIALCVLSARVMSGIAALLFTSRRSRDLAGIIVVAIIALAAPVAGMLVGVDWEARALPVVRRIAAIAQWTPFGAAWAAPGDAALGDPGSALGKLGIALAGVVVLAAAWYAVVVWMLARSRREASERVRSGLGWFARVPASPAWGIAARSMSYWGRDRRYAFAFAIVPVLPLVIVPVLLVGGIPVEIVQWVPVPVMCLFLGWAAHNDLAHDSSAFWTHVAANVSGRADRWGRLVPALLLGIPIAVGGSAATIAITGDWAAFPALAGLSLGVLLSALGTASVTSAALPYPTVLPGDSPFAQPQSTNGGASAQAVAFLMPILLATPTGWLIVLGVTADPQWLLAAAGAGLLTGVVALLGGVAWGGWLVAHRAPELLAFTMQN